MPQAQQPKTYIYVGVVEDCLKSNHNNISTDQGDCEVLCAAYNEPMITAEWACDVFAQAKARGLINVMVSDGHTTKEDLTYMRPVMDVYRIDLKGFDADQNRRLGGRLGAVLDAIGTARALGY